MGALTHSKLDRAVVARYFTFLIISQLIIFTLLGIIFSMFHFLTGVVHYPDDYFVGSVQQIIAQIGKKASFQEIIDNLHGQSILEFGQVVSAAQFHIFRTT